MPLKNGKLTPRERSFAAVYAKTGDVAYASTKAGFRDMRGGANALARAGVRDEVERLFREELQGEILPLALKRHRQILSDPSVRGQTLNKAIQLAYAHGFGRREDDPADAEVHEMSAGQLARMLLSASLDPYVADIPSEPEAAAAGVEIFA